jgi:hypothetical protein
MKKLDFKLVTLLISAFILVFVLSCDKDDDPKPGNDKPVNGEDFTFIVDGNKVTFTTTLTGNVWFKDEGSSSEYPTVSGKVEVFLAAAGTYSFTCNTLIEGAKVASDPFNVIIEQDDDSYLDNKKWIYLTGGRGKTKSWRVDMNANGKCLYFAGPLYYSGVECDPWWSWDVIDTELPYTLACDKAEYTGYFNWEPDYSGNKWIMAAADYGTITFDGGALTASTQKFGATESGTFTFDTATMKLKLNGVSMPLDTSRLNDNQYEDLYTLRIFTIADSSMQVGIKRHTEDGKESKWINVYNFVCTDYTYPVTEEFTYSEVPKTTITAADLVGTWKYAGVPTGWISWDAQGDLGTHYPARLLEKWDDRTEIVTVLNDEWGLTGIGDVFTANDANTYVFENDGTCTLNGVDNTFTVANGIISLGDTLKHTEFNITLDGSWLSNILKGTEITVIDVKNYGGQEDYEAYTPEGLWIGQRNDEKPEYTGFQLVKQ